MKTKVLTIALAILMVFSLVFAASADTRAQSETAPCGHDHCTECEMHEHIHEHKESALAEKTVAPVKIGELKPVETPEAVVEEPEIIEPVVVSEETEEPEIIEPVVVSEETEEPEIIEPVVVSEETEEPEIIEPVVVSEETEEPETCPHENTWDGWYWKDCTYTDTGDNKTHEVSGIRVNYTYCGDCDTYIMGQEEAYSDTEEHYYDENGVCTVCGHVNTCSHENTRDDWYWKECTYTDTGDNKAHEVSGIRVNYIYCDDCNMYVMEQEEEYSETEEHYYDENGVCLNCGHVNTCPHENAYDSWYWETIDSITDTGDDLTHEASGTRVLYTYCWDCGIFISKHSEAYTGPQNHSYDENGVCQCGHMNVCAHENTWDSWYWKGDPTFTDTGDNRTHEVTGIRVNYTFCVDCNTYVMEEEEEYTGSEDHNYDENGVCRECGHVNSCRHEITVTDCFLQNEDECIYEDTGDNAMHHVIGTRSIYTYCAICGMTISVDEDVYDGPDYHTYDENGVCIYCGHSNTCKHKHQGTYFYWKDESKNSFTDTGDHLMHIANGIVVYETFCTDCGMVLSSREDKHSEPEYHDYMNIYGNSVCRLCGHVCSHEHTSKWYRWDWDTVTFTDTGDNSTHQACGTRYIFDICEDCGMELPGYEEEYNGPEKHLYDENGVCMRCGHVKVVAIDVTVGRGGSVHGNGTYNVGETVTLIAKANKGYVFMGWKENGKIVSRSDSYTFTAEADRTLTAVFLLKGARFDPVVKPINPIKPIPWNPGEIVR